MINYLELLDPTAIIVIGGIFLKMVAPVLNSIHLSHKQQNLLTAAKRVVTYAAQQSGLDDVQRRKLAEHGLTMWANKHQIEVSETTVTTVVEYAYQLMKNSADIDVVAYKIPEHTIDEVPTDKTTDKVQDVNRTNLPNIDPEFLKKVQGGNK